MWDVENHTPFAHRGGFMRDQEARSLWCLHLKASFDLRHDRPCLLAKRQEPLHQAPLIRDGDYLADSDISLPKRLCDILLDGSVSGAAPRDLTLAIGDWQKTLHLRPALLWDERQGQYPAPREAEPLPVSLGRSQSWGGPEIAANPAGHGAYPNPANGPVPVPRLAVSASETYDPRQGTPCGFGAIAPEWPERSRLGGSYDANWMRSRAPLLPKDLDPEYWQAAPQDQRLPGERVAGQELRLINLSPDLAMGRFPLPAPQFEIATRFRGRWHQQEAQLQTLAISLATMQITMSWVATFPIGAVQNDVMVERSAIALRHPGGFHVRAEDAWRVNSPAPSEEA